MARGELMNINYPKYEAYKETGIQWLPRVPAGWHTIAIKRIVAIPVTDGPHETPEMLD